MSVHHSRKSFFFDKRWHKDDLQSSKCKDGRTLASDLLWCFSLLVDLTEGLKCRRDLSRSYHPFTRAHLSLPLVNDHFLWPWPYGPCHLQNALELKWFEYKFCLCQRSEFPHKLFEKLCFVTGATKCSRWGCVNVVYMKCATVPASFSVVLTPLHKLTVDGAHSSLLFSLHNLEISIMHFTRFIQVW